MADIYDIKLNSNYEPLVKKGDFVIEESTQQHQEFLLIANKGQFRQFPVTGVGINNFLLDESDPEELRLEIYKQFELDGMQVNEIDISDLSNIFIDATYK